MGSHSRKKSNQHQSSSSSSRRHLEQLASSSNNSRNSASPNASVHVSKKADLVGSEELCLAVEQVESLLFRLSWKELIVLITLSVGISVASVSLALFAEVSLVVHFYDRPVAATTLVPPSFEDVEARQERFQVHKRRVTRTEPDMVALNRKHLTQLERVMDVDPFGHPTVVRVVHREDDQDASPQMPTTGYHELATIRPKLCSDGVTYGYDDWQTLSDAIAEANTLDQDFYIRWARYFASMDDDSGVLPLDALYYEHDVTMTICPNARLRARKGPIFINTHNLVLECDGCSIEVGASHFSFGRRARNVRLRGMTFRKAQTSSLVFYHNGAHVALEDCSWWDNAAVTRRFGAVADVNSSSSVSFSRCQIFTSQRGESPGLVSSLSVRA